jgi:hypothetical protein
MDHELQTVPDSSERQVSVPPIQYQGLTYAFLERLKHAWQTIARNLFRTLVESFLKRLNHAWQTIVRKAHLLGWTLTFALAVLFGITTWRLGAEQLMYARLSYEQSISNATGNPPTFPIGPVSPSVVQMCLDFPDHPVRENPVIHGALGAN